MAIKKKRKKRFQTGTSAGSRFSRDRAPLRPKHVAKLPPCRDACPSSNRIREFLTTIAQAERLEKPTQEAFRQAWEIYTETSPFPAVCGRLCPAPCEEGCNRKTLDGPVGINAAERAIGDFALSTKLGLRTLTGQQHAEKIAVVGAGPGGLSCAYQLARRGYGVTVFEAAEKPGGMLLGDSAASRLPSEVRDGEIQRILDLGVKLSCNTRIGTDVALEDLRARYQAVVVSAGAEKDLKLSVEDEQAGNLILVSTTDTVVGSGDREAGPAHGDAASLALLSGAIGQGRRAAELADRKLRGETPPQCAEPPLIQAARMRLDHYPKKQPVLGAAPTSGEPSAGTPTEPGSAASQDLLIEETRRCMSCGYCFDCEKCWLFCQEQAIEKSMQKGVLYTFKLENCTGCGKCAKECPCGFIDML